MDADNMHRLDTKTIAARIALGDLVGAYRDAGREAEADLVSHYHQRLGDLFAAASKEAAT